MAAFLYLDFTLRRQQQQLPMVIGKIGPILEMGGGSSQFSSQPGKPSIARAVTQIILTLLVALQHTLVTRSLGCLFYFAFAAPVNSQPISTGTMLLLEQ